MTRDGYDVARGLEALRAAVAQILLAPPLATPGGPTVLLSEASVTHGPAPARTGGGYDDADQARSSG